MVYQEMLRRMNGLVIFRDLLGDEVVCAFRKMLQARCQQNAESFTECCADFEARLFVHGDDWGAYLQEAVLVSENVCIRGIAQGAVTEVMETCLDRELELLDRMAQVTLESLLEGMEDGPDFLVGWRCEPRDITADYRERLAHVSSKGYGIFARYHMFTVENGALVPVKHPDPQQLEELPGYEKEREKVIANTKALLAGKPANNDLREGKITLPLIEVLEQCSSAERLQLLDKLSQCATDESAVDFLQGVVEATGGLAMAARTMQTYINRATSILAKYADSPYRTSLINLCAFVAERDR